MLRFIAAGLAISGATITVRAAWPFVAPKLKGYLGEAKVKRILSRFHSKECFSAHDFLIPGGRDTTQLDHVLINRHGIFVIETKNYTGRITGGTDTQMWTQHTPHSEPRKFLNPLKQNESHVKALRKILRKYPRIPVHNIVVFSDKCSIPAIPNVVKMRDLKYAVQIRCKREPILSADEVRDIYKIIDNSKINGRKTRDQHDIKAQLASEAKALTKEDMDNLKEVAMNSPILSFGEKKAEEMPRPLEQRRLTDAGAIVNIRSQRGSIEDIFEAAKRDEKGNPVPRGANFDHFICPYTGDSFPVSEAKSFYEGLWITFLTRNPDLAEYLHEHADEKLGDTFRCQRALAAYAQDKDSFIGQVKKSVWYQNVRSRQSGKNQTYSPSKASNYRKPLDKQISNAQSRQSYGSASREDNKSFVR